MTLSRVIVCFIAAATAWPADAPVTKPLTENQVLKFELISTLERINRLEADKIASDKITFFESVCKEAGIKVSECSVDLPKQVVKQVLPVPQK